MSSPNLENKTFVLLLGIVSVAFIVVLLPFYGAVFWGTVLAILFAPLYRYILGRMPTRKNMAALATLLIILVIVILPLALIGASLTSQAIVVYERIRSGELNYAAYFQQVVGALPTWAVNLLDRFGLGNISAIQETISASVGQASQLIATRALSITQNAFEFIVAFGVMLYLLYFLLRDGAALSRKIRDVIPLDPAHKRDLFSKFTTVIRATVKGNVIIAITQGVLGGLIFMFLGIQASLLWGVAMAFLSLLPAIGAGLIWIPVAVYFLATGAIWQGVTLIVFGVVVIGLVDNILRPILVGKDTKLPDYVVLISTLGGMAVFGLNGFVIGPVIAALFIAAWDLFGSSRDELSR
ncbi:AI-2E family transporter [soil metagenome]